MYIFKKNMLRYVLNICIIGNEYKYIHVNIFQIYAVCECLYKYTQYTQIYYVNKLFILDAINRLTALNINIIYYSYSRLHGKHYMHQYSDIEIETRRRNLLIS